MRYCINSETTKQAESWKILNSQIFFASSKSLENSSGLCFTLHSQSVATGERKVTEERGQTSLAYSRVLSRILFK